MNPKALRRRPEVAPVAMRRNREITHPEGYGGEERHVGHFLPQGILFRGVGLGNRLHETQPNQILRKHY